MTLHFGVFLWEPVPICYVDNLLCPVLTLDEQAWVAISVSINPKGAGWS